MKTNRKSKKKTAIPFMEKYMQYEILKTHIAETSKTYEEYENRIKTLCDKLGI